MRTGWMTALLLGCLCAPLSSFAQDGFESIFDGQTLKNWDGNPEFWRVEDGCITGQTTEEKPTKGNTFIIWRGGETGDFELTLDYKIVGGNSGVQYRSFEVPDNKWVVGGYQADIDSGDTYSGINYGERFRGILANRGQKTVLTEVEVEKKDKEGNVKKVKEVKVTVVEKLGESADIQAKIKKEDWNSYHIIAKGNTFEHRINGVVTSICTDEHPAFRKTGVLALQLHAGPPMKVQFKNIKLKQAPATAVVAPKKVLLLAGNRSHGFGAHDHTAGCALLAKLLIQSGLPIQAEMHSLQTSGWPSAEKLAGVNSIVIYSDGGGGHPFNAHLDELNQLVAKGVGIVCIHYGVETTKGPNGDAFLNWTGGYFEPHWSVNPHWTANYSKFPDHQVTRGVQPFKINDEWYYHMRFREKMEGVTPLLTDLPPKESLSRGDGPHSGNPEVRKAVLERMEPQHMAWATEDSATHHRGFGCSGGHVHWNWGHNQFRKFFLNAIVWTAGLDVPVDGVSPGVVTIDDMLQNHDEPIPADFNKARYQAMFDEWNAVAGK